MKLKKTDNPEYIDWIKDLKSKTQTAQLKAAVSVNKELLSLYWEIGKSISIKITKSNWGSSIVEELSKDLKSDLPTVEKIEQELKNFTKTS
jgi:hypothetical protein